MSGAKASLLPDLRGFLPPEVDLPAFVAWLAPQLERYQAEQLRQLEEPAKAHDLAQIEQLLEHLRLARAGLVNLPAIAATKLHLLLRAQLEESGETVTQILTRAKADLLLLRTALALVETDIDQSRDQPKMNPERDKLLASIVDQLALLGIRKRIGRTVAANVLARWGIDV